MNINIQQVSYYAGNDKRLSQCLHGLSTN